jgi:hypothetical protein
VLCETEERVTAAEWRVAALEAATPVLRVAGGTARTTVVARVDVLLAAPCTRGRQHCVCVDVGGCERWRSGTAATRR